MKEMIRSTWIGKATLWGPLLVVLLLAGGALAHAQAGDGYDLSWWTADSGGQTHQTGEGYTLGGTLGQPDAGMLIGPGYTLSGGFWQGAADIYRVYLPLVVRSDP
jgi:hypothetical protein